MLGTTTQTIEAIEKAVVCPAARGTRTWFALAAGRLREPRRVARESSFLRSVQAAGGRCGEFNTNVVFMLSALY